MIESAATNLIYEDSTMRAYRVERGIERILLAPFPAEHPCISATDYDCGRKISLRFGLADLPWTANMGHFWKAINMRHCMMRAMNLLLHSSYVKTEQGALLFPGEARVGKSTQAMLWARYRGAKIVNGDRAVIGMERGQAMAYGVPLVGSGLICQNISAPLRAVVVVRQGEENSVVRLTGPRAVAAVGANLAIDRWRAGEYATALSILEQILADVPVYQLSCTPDEGAVQALEKVLKEEGR